MDEFPEVPPCKVLYNKDYGGFGISDTAVLRLRECGYHPAFNMVLIGETYSTGEICDETYNSHHMCSRTDQAVLDVVDQLGKEAWGAHATLAVATMQGPFWKIEEYDGHETVYADLPPIQTVYVYEDGVSSLKPFPDKTLVRTYPAYVHCGYAWELVGSKPLLICNAK